MAYPMGESKPEPLRVVFDRRLKLEFHGSDITSDGGLLPCRELDGALGLSVRATQRVLSVGAWERPGMWHMPSYSPTSGTVGTSRSCVILPDIRTSVLGGTIRFPRSLGVAFLYLRLGYIRVDSFPDA